MGWKTPFDAPAKVVALLTLTRELDFPDELMLMTDTHAKFQAQRQAVQKLK